MGNTSNLPHSFSGQDFNIWAYLPDITNSSADAQPVRFGNLQTITTSLASSIAPVQAVGTDAVLGLTTGSKTFAGTIVFSLLDKDPLDAMIARAETQLIRSRGHEFFTIDQLPPFNVVIQGSNEYVPGNYTNSTPNIGSRYDKLDVYKLIIGLKLLTHGETISIDDFFTEQTYQYQARYITPWRYGTPDNNLLLSTVQAAGVTDLFTPYPIDTAALEALAAVSTLRGQMDVLKGIQAESL